MVQLFDLQQLPGMINKLDTYFYVGTVHRHPKNWIIVGLFYPTKPPALARFE